MAKKITIHQDTDSIADIYARLGLSDRAQKAKNAYGTKHEEDPVSQRQAEISNALSESSYADLYRRIGLLPSDQQETQQNTVTPSVSPVQSRMQSTMTDAWLDRVRNPVSSKAEQQKNGVVSTTTLVSTTPNTNSTRESKKTSPLDNVLDAINYVNARGEQALDAFNENLNAFGEGILNSIRGVGNAVSAGANTTASGLKTPSLNVLGNSRKPTFQSSTDENGRIKSADDLQETAGASSVSGKAREGYTNALEKAAKNNQNQKALEEIENQYKTASSNPAVKTLADLNAVIMGQVPYVALNAIPGIGTALSAASRGALSSVDAYTEARNEGATKSLAREYAGREAINQSVGDLLISGIAGKGQGVLGKIAANTKAGRALARAYGTHITAPALKTGIKYFGTMLGEGVEESLQDVITNANKRGTYNPDARVSGSDLLYSGILGGLTAGVFNATSVPSTYRAYRSDFDTVNNMAKAAASVTNEEEARYIKLQLDILIDECNVGLGESAAPVNETDFDTRARYEYLKNGLERIRSTLDTDARSIVEYNTDFDDAINNVYDSTSDSIVDDVANVVEIVSDHIEPDADVIRSTVDRVNDAVVDVNETLNAVNAMDENEFVDWMRYNRMSGPFANIITTATGSQNNLLTGPTTNVNTQTVDAIKNQVTNELQVRKAIFDHINSILRNQKSDVKQTIQDYFNYRANNQNNQVGLLTSGDNNGMIEPETAVIPVSNPVVQADGDSLIPRTETKTPSEGEPKYSLVQKDYTHTKTGEHLNLFQIDTTLSKEDYADLKKAMKEVDGYWSGFAKGFIVPEGKVDDLNGVLGKINVGLKDERNRTTNESKANGSTDTIGQIPKFEVVNNAPVSETTTKERDNIPKFETASEANLIPVNDNTEVTESGKDLSANEVFTSTNPNDTVTTETKPSSDTESLSDINVQKTPSSKTNVNAQREKRNSDSEDTLAAHPVGMGDERKPVVPTPKKTTSKTPETPEPLIAPADKIQPTAKVLSALKRMLKVDKYRKGDNRIPNGYFDLDGWNTFTDFNRIVATDYDVSSLPQNTSRYIDDYSKKLNQFLLDAQKNQNISDPITAPSSDILKQYIQEYKGRPDRAFPITSMVYANPEYLKDIVDAFPDAVFYVDKPTTFIYYTANRGHGLVMPMRVPYSDAVGHTNVAKKIGWNVPNHEDLLIVNHQSENQNQTKKEQKEESSAKPVTTPEVNKPDKSESKTVTKADASSKVADWVSDRLSRDVQIDKKDLQIVANDAFGGTQAQGVYDVKDMTDALELGVNRYLINDIEAHTDEYTGNARSAQNTLSDIEKFVLKNIPTQTNRTEGQIANQQFSTPPNIAFVANWVANIDKNDTVLEPSAGVGGLASFGKGIGAKVYVNEWDPRRLDLLRQLPFDGYYQENAEQIDNILPDHVKPTVVIMNPPFSANGRTKNKTANAIPHIEQALERLEDGGRLVAILGGGREAGSGMSDNSPSFKSWWNDLRKKYNIRANIGIDGSNYTKYGTSFNVRLVVIDKTGPQDGETFIKEYKDLSEVPADLERIRNDRQRNTRKADAETQRNGTVPVGKGNSESNSGSRVNVRTGTGKSASDGNSVDDRTGGVQSVSSGDSERNTGNVEPQSTGTIQETDNQRGTGRGRESGTDERPDRNSERSRGSASTGDESGRGTFEQSGELVSPVSGAVGAGGEVISDERKVSTKKQKTSQKASENDDGVYAEYKPADLPFKNAKKHPAVLVESSAMSAVASPPITYTPKLDSKLIASGAWSDAQLENICYAGQAQQDKLPNGERKGYFVGDGTGVGKGRQIAGIIMDNFNRGRKKAIWVSEKWGLLEDAKRDWIDAGGDESQVFAYADAIKKKTGLPSSGIMFITYDTLKSTSSKNGESTLDKVESWFGKDFDGVLIFDEAHNMGNLKPMKTGFGAAKASKKAIAGDKIQHDLPNARVAYFSATGATKVENLSYASRLGLWGEGTAFRDSTDFVTKIGASGISAMELVARDMKAMGVYLARSISYDGVVYDNLNHELDSTQRSMYDRMSDAWQVVLQNFDKAIDLTDSKNALAVKRARSQAYSNMQMFYNQVLTSMAMPSVIADIEKELNKGHSCVIQLVNTNEAATDREVQKAKENDESLDNVDITPRELLVGYVERAFPVLQYEEYLDENGNLQSRPVVDSNNNPVLNKQAVRMRDELIADLNEISIPEGPLDQLLDAFGTDKVAEITGRKKRLVNRPDENGNIRRVLDDRKDTNKANIAETKAFQDGEKHILVFSGAGSTGRSFHADKRAKNQQQRIHYVLQPGWKAETAVQGFGRTHRSNQVSAPVFRLVSTDVKGHKRFVTSIAKRLEQLGALTKGQRETGSGVFGEKDNLESPLSEEALKSFYKKMARGQYGNLDAEDVLQKMGLYDYFYDEYGNFNSNSPKLGEITTFLNRLLALQVDLQNQVFDAFWDERDRMYNEAIQNGTLDRGLENVKADKIDIADEQTVYTDPKTGAETKYILAKLYNKPSVVTTVDEAEKVYPGFSGIYRLSDGSVRAAYRKKDGTDSRTGEVYRQFLLVGPNQGKASNYRESTLKATCQELKKDEWQKAWDEELANVPEYNEGETHMITGALLPVWDKLPQSGSIKAKRIISSDNSQYLGRVIDASTIDSVLRQLGASVTKISRSGSELRQLIMGQGKEVTFNGSYGSVYTVGRKRVSNENRMEISGGNTWSLRQDFPDLIQETIQYSRRYFIPDSKKGEEILQKLSDKYGIRSIGEEENSGVYFSAGLSRGKWGKGNRDKNAQVMSVNDLVEEAKRIFGIPINVGRMGSVKRSVQGVFKEHPESVRTRTYGDLPNVAHEIGHWFDKKYRLHESPYIKSVVSEFESDFEKAGYQKSQYTREAVAEYFREYMSDKEATEKKFRQFTNWMYQTINPTDSKRLADYSTMSNGYFAADADRRASAQVHYRTDDASIQYKTQTVAEQMKRNPQEYLGNLSRNFVRNWFDDLVDLRGFGNTYDLAFYEKQARSIAYGRLTSAFTDSNGNVIGRSLSDILTDAKIDDRNARAFDEYLIARRALDQFEAAERGENVGTLVYADEELNNADSVAERIDQYERENPMFHRASEGVYEYERNLLDLAVNSGLMSEELRDRLNELYPHYVPLYRVMDDKTKSRGAKRGYADQNTPIARFKGSGRDIYSPIESIIQNTEKFTAACMRNDVMVEFANFIDQNEGYGWAGELIPPKKILDFVSTDELGKRLDSFTKQTDKLNTMNAEEKADLVESIMSFVGDTLSQWKPAAKQGKNVVSVMRNGQRSYYEIHDEGLYKALTNMDAPQFDLVTQFFGAVTRANKFFYTTSNPQFVFTNPQRDIVTGFISSTTTDNPFRYIADFAKAFKDAVMNSEDYQEYVRNGGGYMGSVTSDYNLLKRVSKDVINPNRSNIRKFFDLVAGTIPRLVDAGETASRLAEWKRALNQGADNTEAMRKAQEVTVNFARGGRIVKQINQYIPFFMAGFNAIGHTYDLFVNGGDGGGGRNGNNGYGLNLTPEGKARRHKAWIKWFLTTAMLALFTWLYNYLIAPKVTGESEQKVKEESDNLSNYNKNAFYNLYIGDGKFVRIKKTPDMAIPATIVERMTEYYVLDQKDSMNGLADFVFDNVLPVNPFNGDNIIDGALSVVGEVSLIGTAVDLARNKDFKGTPILSSRYQYLPKEEQFKENTSTVWIGLGKALGTSPIQLQYAAEDNFGWAARLIDNLTPYNGERSLGIKNKLVTDSVYSTDIINNFYDQKDVYEKASKAYKANPNSGRYSVEDVLGAYKYGKVADLYSDLNRFTRDEGNNDLSREMRAKTNALIQTVNEEGISDLDRAVIDIAESTKTEITDIAPYIVTPDHITIKVNKQSVELPLDYDDMYAYYTQAQTAFENVYGNIIQSGYDDSTTAQLLVEARKVINKEMRDTWAKNLLAERTGQ